MHLDGGKDEEALWRLGQALLLQRQRSSRPDMRARR
jgi:hypothetical protein